MKCIIRFCRWETAAKQKPRQYNAHKWTSLIYTACDIVMRRIASVVYFTFSCHSNLLLATLELYLSLWWVVASLHCFRGFPYILDVATSFNGRLSNHRKTVISRCSSRELIKHASPLRLPSIDDTLQFDGFIDVLNDPRIRWPNNDLYRCHFSAIDAVSVCSSQSTFK
jgi:hypothetical protein